MELNARIPDGPIDKKWDKHRFDMKLINPANKRKYSVIVGGSGLAGGAGAAALAELGYTKNEPLDRKARARVDRLAISRACVEHGLLTFTRRSITPQLKSHFVTNIS